jgi:hypothetical protein
MKLKQLSLLNRRGVDQGYSLFMLLMLTGLMIFLIVGCDHNITSSGFVVFSRAKQPPTGFYTGMRNHEKTGKDAKPEPYPALTGLEVAANSERWVINITPAKDGLMRVELGMTAQMTAAKAQPARTHTICRLSRFSERVSISHIMDWQSLEYYQFSAALWDPVMTEEPDWVLEKFPLDKSTWQALSGPERRVLGQRMAEVYRDQLRQNGWPINPKHEPKKDREVERYRDRIANFVFAFNPGSKTLHYVDDVYDSLPPIKDDAGLPNEFDKDSIEHRFGSVQRYKAWLKQRIPELNPPRTDEYTFTWRRHSKAALLDDIQSLSYSFLWKLHDEIPE